MGYAAIGAMFYFLIIFIAVWYLGQLCSVMGIVFSCLTITNSNKFVQTKGYGNFKTTKKYRVASLVFMILSCLIVALWVAFFIWYEAESRTYASNDEDIIEMLSVVFSEGIPMLAVHIASVVTGIIAQVKYGPANSLYEDILSGRVKAPAPPVMPVYQNPYQQYYRNGYPQGQPNQYQQNQYYQNGYRQAQQPNQYQQNGYVQPNQYQPNGGYYTTQTTQPTQPAQTPQNIIQSGQPQAAGTEDKGGTVKNTAEDNAVICPACGKSNLPNYKFCSYCGNQIK